MPWSHIWLIWIEHFLKFTKKLNLKFNQIFLFIYSVTKKTQYINSHFLKARQTSPRENVWPYWMNCMNELNIISRTMKNRLFTSLKAWVILKILKPFLIRSVFYTNVLKTFLKVTGMTHSRNVAHSKIFPPNFPQKSSDT